MQRRGPFPDRPPEFRGHPARWPIRVALSIALGLFVAPSTPLFAQAPAPAAAAPAGNPWASGGGPTAAGPAAPVPVAQAYAMPATVVHGGAIPAGWQPQPIPYQGIGADGRPVTIYVAPTYTFTYVAGPPVAAPQTNRVNRIQAVPPPTTAYMRAPPAPYQYPPGSTALAGQALAPPPTPVAAPYQVPAQAPLPAPAQPLSAPPTQWVSVPPSNTLVQPGNDAAAMALAGAAPAAMAGTAGALAATDRAPPPAAILPPAQSPPQSPVQSPAAAPAPPPVQAPAAAPAPPAVVPVDPPLEPVSQRSAAAPPGARSAPHQWRVVGVHDGDTLTCLDENNDQQKVRLAEIDAPELGQDYGRVARESLAELVFGKTVTVADEGKDRYGRWIARMQVDGVDVNRRLVATGNAWHYSDYSRDAALETLQDQARSQRLGLWAQADPVPPWDFRQSVKKDPAT